MTYRILVTGSREWGDTDTIFKALYEVCEKAGPGGAWRSGKPVDVVIVHGDCPTGADAIAQIFAEMYSVPTERHPADWSIGKKAGPLRNKEMVGLGADIVLAFPLGKSIGTRGTIKLAEEAGLEVLEFEGNTE